MTVQSAELVERVPIDPAPSVREPRPLAGLHALAARPEAMGVDVRAHAWIAIAGSLILAGLAYVADQPYGIAAFGGVACVLGAILVPQAVLALVVTVGGFKAAPWLQPIPGDVTVLAALGLITLIALRMWTRPVAAFPPASLLAVVMALLVVLSVLWSPVPEEGLAKALRFEILTLLVFFAPFVLVRDRGDFTMVMAGLLGFALLIALTADETGNPLKPLTVVGGNDTNQIDLAIFCAVGLLAAAYLGLRGGRLVRIGAVGAAGILMYTLIAAGSRGILAGAVLALVYVMVTLTGKVISRTVALSAVALVIVVGAIAAQAAPEAVSRYNELLLSGDADAVLGQREYLFDKGVELAVANPLGHGSASYPAVTGGLVYPHNVELELADEHGLLSVAVFLALVIASWRARRRAYRAGWRVESVVVGALIVVLFFDAQVSHGLNDSRPLWLALGLALALPRLSGEPPERDGRGPLSGRRLRAVRARRA